MDARPTSAAHVMTGAPCIGASNRSSHMIPLFLKRTLIATALLGCTLSAFASVVLGGTRMVYDEARQEVSIPVNNEGKRPVLVQTWVDDGNADARREEMRVPFLVTPPVARIEPGKGQSLRIRKTGGELPRDRESVYYLNVVSIPPKPEGKQGEGQMQIAIRSRIKMFYRPSGLPGAAEDAPQQLRWALVTDAASGELMLEASNPTAYNVSFSRIGLKAGNTLHTKGFGMNGGGGMVGPRATQRFPLDGIKVRPGGPLKADIRWIDDFGSRHDIVTDLTG